MVSRVEDFAGSDAISVMGELDDSVLKKSLPKPIYDEIDEKTAVTSNIIDSNDNFL
jgi:hypothetical protein